MSPAQYPKHSAALVYARAQIGVVEVPLGSNHGPLQRFNPNGGVDFYQAHDFLVGDGYAWCISFIHSVWEVGAKHPLPYQTASAYDMLYWARRAGWVAPLSKLVPGDIVIFGIGAGHGAIFEKLEGNQVHTIDGNSGNRVIRRSRHVSTVAGGIHVPEKPVPVNVPKPFWVVATSEDGHRKLVFTKYATQKTVLGLLPRWLTKYGKNGITIKRSKRAVRR